MILSIQYKTIKNSLQTPPSKLAHYLINIMKQKSFKKKKSLILQPKLVWNSLRSPGWPQTCNNSLLPQSLEYRNYRYVTTIPVQVFCCCVFWFVYFN